MAKILKSILIGIGLLIVMYIYVYYDSYKARQSSPYIPTEFRWQTIYYPAQDTVYYVRWGNRVYIRSSNSTDTVILKP